MSEICNNCGHTPDQKCFCGCHSRSARPDEPKGGIEEAFHEAFESVSKECRDRNFREPSSTDFGFGWRTAFEYFQSQLQAERTRREDAELKNRVWSKLCDRLAQAEAVIDHYIAYEFDKYGYDSACQYRDKYPAQDSSSTSESELQVSADGE